MPEMPEKIILHFLAKKNIEGSRWSSVTAMLEVDRVEWPDKDLYLPPPPKLYIGGELISGITLPEIKPGGEIVAILRKVGEGVRFHPLGFIDKIEVLPEKTKDEK
jgi:hypothetical protein